MISFVALFKSSPGIFWDLPLMFSILHAFVHRYPIALLYVFLYKESDSLGMDVMKSHLDRLNKAIAHYAEELNV